MSIEEHEKVRLIVCRKRNGERGHVQIEYFVIALFITCRRGEVGVGVGLFVGGYVRTCITARARPGVAKYHYINGPSLQYVFTTVKSWNAERTGDQNESVCKLRGCVGSIKVDQSLTPPSICPFFP